ncbi:hypothetical protein UFOVP296_3 [uncultured Caudovirales phage]|uniref:HTH_XRE domain containing protein n=1 Tax=uncultured Caudovirales phage TaxID=2100421 RepID=A0A6J5RXZ9_9CAUD|nr:hypothetical protein UFOVP296_3 [uncultured Caudovirales phage]CAB4169958.1 hypothetical protein UFOVP912_22 [uncultured Caudovirales phage]CAB4199046.1 hypothetical protein UFOVP1334_10 [uncultured Caudovirales phage]
MPETIARDLIAYRTANGIDREELGKLLSMSGRSIRCIEDGSANPPHVTQCEGMRARLAIASAPPVVVTRWATEDDLVTVPASNLIQTGPNQWESR